MHNLFRSLVLWLLAFTALPVLVTAQQLPTTGGQRQNTVKNAFLPAISYNSDMGLIGGGIYNRFDYRGKVKPFRSYTQATLLGSTRGFFQLRLAYDQTHSFGTDIRSHVEAYGSRMYENNYFGVGNRTDFNQDRWDNQYYFYESVSAGIDYKARKPLYKRASRGRLDFLMLAGTSYHLPYIKQQQSVMNLNPPVGITGGWTNYLGTGLLWENRDSEFNPTTGNYLELDLKYAPKFLLSDYNVGIAKFEYRQYFHFHLIRDVVVANRLALRHAGGDVPYWELSYLGDDMQMRGYPYFRYQGNSSVVHSLELRTWLFGFPKYGIKFGGQLFTDSGRVFTAENDWGDLFRGYKRTYGFGGAMSLFSPDFIVRGDIGFSNEMHRIYVGVGYVF